jgi:hypothetical protein
MIGRPVVAQELRPDRADIVPTVKNCKQRVEPARMPMLLAAPKPRFVGASVTLTSGNVARTSSTVPSADALSIT